MLWLSKVSAAPRWHGLITAVVGASRQLQPTPSLMQPAQVLPDLRQVGFDRFQFLPPLVSEQYAHFAVEFFA
ncbi:hypothetical protein D3C77_466120 [compost metagenome]